MFTYPVLIAARYALWAFELLLIVRVIASWVRVSPYDRRWGPVVSLAERVTDPLLEPIRRVLDPYQRGTRIDFSPFVLWMILELAFRLLTNMFRGLPG